LPILLVLLTSEGPSTTVPLDDAFSALPDGTVQTLVENKEQLTHFDVPCSFFGKIVRLAHGMKTAMVKHNDSFKRLKGLYQWCGSSYSWGW
jgi:hypothetical protein